MTITRRVSVEKNRLRFAAAHFATFFGDCEPLHGHNYVISVHLEGDITEDSWVWDFGDLKQLTKDIADILDHKFILQRESRILKIKENATNWEINHADKQYVFPKSDVIALPIDNSTAERIAEWFAEQLVKSLSTRKGKFTKLTVGIEEMPGQAGWYTLDMQPSFTA